MALQLRAHTTPAEDLSLVPRTHIEWVTIVYNSSSRGHETLFSSPKASALTPTHLHINTNKYTKLKDKIFSAPVDY